jgi:anti-anti-sigma factor
MATTSSARALSPRPERTESVRWIEVTARESNGEVVVRVAGKGCVGQAATLATGLLGLSTRRQAQVALDLSGLKCVSSLALGVLVAFRRGIVRSGGRVRLAPSLQSPVRKRLEEAGLLPLFGLSEG